MTVEKERLQTPTLGDVISRALDNRLASVHVSLPGRIETFDNAKNSANVKPLVQIGRTNEDTGERDIVSIPVVPSVPVIMYGSGGVRVKIPISRGDTGLLVFSEASLDRWLQRGGEVDPDDDRRFDLSDAVFIPGLQSFNEAGDADPQIEFTESGEIHAGGSDQLATKADISALFNAISGAAVTAGDGGAAFKANILLALTGWPGVTGTNVLKGS